MDWTKYLESIYYHPKQPASYSSPKKLLKTICVKGKWDISFGKIKEWLSGQDTYTMHRPSRKKFTRNKVVVDAMDELLDMDLVDMTYMSKYNDGYLCILVIVDIFSKYAWAVPIKSKKAVDVLIGLHLLFNMTERIPLPFDLIKGPISLIKQLHVFSKIMPFYIRLHKTRSKPIT